jgi:hypothetical protein
MQAPIRLRYRGYHRKRGDVSEVKTKYLGYDPGLDVENDQERLVSLTVEGPNNIHEASLEFARAKLNSHPDEWEVVDDPDGSKREAILASRPVKAVASANIVVIYPDGRRVECPPGTDISIQQPEPALDLGKRIREATHEVQGDKPLERAYTEQELFKLSKPKIQRAAARYLDAELDPDRMNKRGMVDEYLRLQSERS